MNQQNVKENTSERPSLPFPKLKIDTQIRILQALTDWHERNKKPVRYLDIGGVHASKANVSSTLQFFSKIEWLQKGKNGGFMPCDDLVKYFEGFDQQSAANNLAKKVLQTPMGKKLSFFLEQRGKANEADIVTYLGSEFGLKKGDKTGIVRFIDLLVTLGLLSREGDVVRCQKLQASIPEKPEEMVPKQETDEVVTSGPLNFIFGVLIDANTPEEKIRKAVKAVLEEIKKVKRHEEK